MPCRKLVMGRESRPGIIYEFQARITNFMMMGRTQVRPNTRLILKSKIALGSLSLFAIALISVACGGEGASSLELDDGQELVPVKLGNLAKDIPVDGALVFPHTATLKFESSGVVGDVMTTEGARVRSGDALVSFDRLRMAQLEKSLAESRVGLRLAQSEMNQLKITNPELVALAQTAAAKAAIAVDAAKDRYDDLVDPQELQLSTVEKAVALALTELDDAEEDYEDLKNGQFPDDVVRDASNAFTFAQTNLDAAQRTFDNAKLEWEDKLRFAQEDADEAYKNHLDLYRFWLGVELTEAELDEDPQDLFEAWGLDLDVTFDRANPAYATGFKPAEENPDTRWREFTVWAWVNLYPGYRSIIGTCEANKILGGSERCIEREFDTQFDLFDAAGDNLVTVTDNASKAIDGAEDALAAAQDKFLDARKDFDDIEDGPEPGELLEAASRLGLAKASLESAEENLALLILNVGPQDIERAQAALDAAQARLDEPTDGLDSVNDNALEVELASAEEALAEARFKAAQIQLQGAAGVHEQQLIAAEAAVEAAREMVDELEADLEGGLIRAPFDGVVAFLNAEEDDLVDDESRIAQVVDPSVVEVHGVVDASNLSFVSEGAAAKITFHDLQGQVLRGTVTSVSRAPRTERGVVSFSVTVRAEVPEGIEIPVTLTKISTAIVGEQTGVLLVPRDAIAADQPGSPPTVKVVRNGSIILQDVVTGESNDGWTVIRSGLEQGEEVVVGGDATSTLQLAEPGDAGSG